MKTAVVLISSLCVAIFSTSCAGVGPKPSGQEIVGNWINHRTETDSSIPPRMLATTTILTLKENGTYEASSEVKAINKTATFKMYSHAGTWTNKGDLLILTPTKMEAGIIPKKLSIIKYRITEITQNSLSLKTKQQLIIYTKNH